MKRSEINQAIRNFLSLLEANMLRLPMFGYWTIEDWRVHARELDNIREVMLGWDVTDFGGGRFERVGAVLFTVRNGKLDAPGVGTPYAEKLMFLRHETEQEIPFHFHRTKTEDIINRGGGILTLELYNSTSDGGLDRVCDIHVKMDGVIKVLPAGAVVEIEKGGSITLTPGLHHRFWAKKGCGDLIAGEVSSINDDRTDNYFFEAPARFSEIEEDEAVIWPLCNEIDRMCI